MEEGYYNTQSIASGGGTTPQQFFYGVGLGSCTLALVWFYNNCYPVTNKRLITDAALAWCRAEVYGQRAMNMLGLIFAPFLQVFRNDKQEPDIFFYQENGDIICRRFSELMHSGFAPDDYTGTNYIAYFIKNENDEGCCRIYRDLNSFCEAEWNNQCRSSNFKVISACLCTKDGKEKPLDLGKWNYYLVGNKLFDRDFLEKSLEISDIPDEYKISIIDGNINNIIVNHDEGLLLNANGGIVVKNNPDDHDEKEDNSESSEDDCGKNVGIFSWFTANNSKPKEA